MGMDIRIITMEAATTIAMGDIRQVSTAEADCTLTVVTITATTPTTIEITTQERIAVGTSVLTTLQQLIKATLCQEQKA